MNPILSAWNAADPDAATATLFSCCAAQRWAQALVARRPFTDEAALFAAADKVWSTMREDDWLQAFRAHPRIGERNVDNATAQSKQWSGHEQSAVDQAQAEILADLAIGNRQYEDRFGFTYIVCATGKSAEEMLQILQRRLYSDRDTEVREAAEQQRQIMQIRLKKWLGDQA
jgi:2-oxo-4-hydroxy-4-carboxy-5-ureidoimidazoline decarboxylase